MSFQEFQFSKVALLSVRWKAHTALCYTEHAAQAGRWPHPSVRPPLLVPGQRWGAALDPRPRRFAQFPEGSAGVRGLSPLSLLPILLSKAAGAQDPVSETSGSPVSGVQRTRTESVCAVLDSLAAFLPGALSPLSRRGTRGRSSLSHFPDCTLGVRCISVIRSVDGFDCVYLLFYLSFNSFIF